MTSKSSFVLGHRHLLGIEGLSANDISGLLELSEEFVQLNRQIEKKTAVLRGRTQINQICMVIRLLDLGSTPTHIGGSGAP